MLLVLVLINSMLGRMSKQEESFFQFSGSTIIMIAWLLSSVWLDVVLHIIVEALSVRDVWCFQHKLCVSRKLAYKPVIQQDTTKIKYTVIAHHHHTYCETSAAIVGNRAALGLAPASMSHSASSRRIIRCVGKTEGRCCKYSHLFWEKIGHWSFSADGNPRWYVSLPTSS